MITENDFITAVTGGITGGIGALLLKGVYDWVIGYKKRRDIRSMFKTDLEKQLVNLNTFEDELSKIINMYLSTYNGEDELVSTFLNKPIIPLKGTNYLDIDSFKAVNLLEVHRAFTPKQFNKLKEIYKSLNGIYGKSPQELYSELRYDIKVLLKERDDFKKNVNVKFMDITFKYAHDFNNKLKTIQHMQPIIKRFIQSTYYDL